MINQKIYCINKHRGFTLIEVLVALTIIAIALTALLKNSAQQVRNNFRLKETSIGHLVGMQAVAMVQLGLVTIPDNQIVTKVTTMLGQPWYWQAKRSKTPVAHVEKITVSLSTKQAGPFGYVLTTFDFRS